MTAVNVSEVFYLITCDLMQLSKYKQKRFAGVSVLENIFFILEMECILQTSLE